MSECTLSNTKSPPNPHLTTTPHLHFSCAPDDDVGASDRDQKTLIAHNITLLNTPQPSQHFNITSNKHKHQLHHSILHIYHLPQLTPLYLVFRNPKNIDLLATSTVPSFSKKHVNAPPPTDNSSNTQQ
jgi:hypothetical protein